MITKTTECRTTVISRDSPAKVLLCGLAVSALYFTIMFLKASRKCFWYDELFTVYLCRLPDFRHIWLAVLHGGDYNPPILYLLTRGVERVFGEGLIVTRLPEMAGVWIFGLCLYLFVARRVGRWSGLVAALFPLFTVIEYYAYDARPHGITVGWCGLALLCWQKSWEAARKRLWLVGFSLSLTGAMLTHLYAVYVVFPFAAVELFYSIRDRRMNWPLISAITLPLAAVLPLYLSFTRLYWNTIPPSFGHASHASLRPFFADAIGPAILVLSFSVAILALGVNRQAKASPQSSGMIPARELLLAAFFVLIPVIGVAGAMLTRGPFLPRYFLSTVAGYAIFLGFASYHRVGRRSAAPFIAGFMLFLTIAELGRAVYLRAANEDYSLINPGNEFRFGPSPQDPLARNQALLGPTNNEAILILRDIDYFYFFQYAPPEVSRRLVFATPASSNLFLGEYHRLAALAKVDLKAMTFAEFFRTHDKFFAYGHSSTTSSEECKECIGEFLSAGYTLKSVRRDTDGVLYEYQK